MKFQKANFDGEHYAMNLSNVGDVLRWDAIGNTHTALFRARYGSKIEITPNDLKFLENVPHDRLLSGKEIKLGTNRYISFIPYSEINNFSFNTVPARYAVFCCVIDTETYKCTLYIPNSSCEYQCDVIYEVTPQVRFIQPKKKLFSRKAEPPYYMVQIPSIPGYEDGGLLYSFSNFDMFKYKYPITKKMLGKSVRIPSYDGGTLRLLAAEGSGYTVTKQES